MAAIAVHTRMPDADTLHDDWAEWTTWALAIASSLASTQSRRSRQQQLIDAIVDRFAAHGVLRVSDATSSCDIIEISGRSPRPRMDDPSQRQRMESRVAVDVATVATITLWRTASDRPFSELDARRLSLLHGGCAWIYGPARSESSTRINQLSPREREALQHLIAGRSEKEVAALLGRSRHTVHSYVKRIYRTLGVRSRPQLRTVFAETNDHASESLTLPCD